MADEETAVEDPKTVGSTVRLNSDEPQRARNYVAETQSRSDAKAAADVGLKRDTATKAAAAIAVADELRAAGDDEAADKIIETLNTKSVSAAAKLAAYE